MEFKCGSWKVVFFFHEENSKNVPKMKDGFQENG